MRRLFTPQEATRTLPLVRSIVSDILACGRTIRNRSESGEVVNEVRVRLGDHITELQRIGCEYKDWGFDVGLVDFPSEIDGEPVWLCWRSDEPELSWYHGVADGYAGRQRIPARLCDESALGAQSALDELGVDESARVSLGRRTR